MRDVHLITQVHRSAARDEELCNGNLTRVRMVVNGLVVRCVGLRRTLNGRLARWFPAQRDGFRTQRFYARPISDEVRRDVELHVCEGLQVRQEPVP